MYCKNCGKEMNEDAKFCSHCGIGEERNPEITKKSSSINKILKICGIILVLIITIPIIIGFIAGFTFGLTGSSEYTKYYNEGVDNFNKGISFFNEGVTNLNKEDITAAISKFEISKDFFSKAITSYDTAMRNSDTNTDMNNKAKYMMQSSDYYRKGLDEYISALRLLEKYKGTNLLAMGAGIILDPGSIASVSSELSEIKIKSEKAKNYFDLAKNAIDSAEKYR